MGSMNAAVLTLGNVKAYRGCMVKMGVVCLSDEDVIKHLNENYSEVNICNINTKPGGALKALFPEMFQVIKGELQEELQNSLQGQLANGNDVDIDFHS